MPHPAPRIVDIAVVSGDDVDVQVKDGLTRGCSGVDTDVVAVGAVLLFDLLFGEGDSLR